MNFNDSYCNTIEPWPDLFEKIYAKAKALFELWLRTLYFFWDSLINLYFSSYAYYITIYNIQYTRICIPFIDIMKLKYALKIVAILKYLLMQVCIENYDKK